MSASSLWSRGTGLPENWRPIDRLLHRWVRMHGGEELLACLAGAASAAEAEGHTALAAGEAGRFGAVWPEAGHWKAWREAGWVDELVGEAPFVLDAGLRFYLRRHALAEQAIAVKLATLAATPWAGAGAKGKVEFTEADLDVLFGGPGDGRDAAQREAVRCCVASSLFVLTGGPGTGKTTTVLRMLLALLRQVDGSPRIAVAAPTGKAAQRLVLALSDGLAGLPATLRDDPQWAKVLARFQQPQALTLHRLLGFQSHRHAFLHTARRPLDLDLLIVDEASMLDLDLLRALCAALPERVALWLVGDADQLSPVGPGSALQDLVQTCEIRINAPLVRLAHGFRAGSAPAALNAALRAGDLEATRTVFAEHPCLRWHTTTDAASLQSALDAWTQALLATRPAALPADVSAAAAAAHAALLDLRKRQWLCALRQGPFGVEAINARIDTRLRREAERAGLPLQDGGYPGRRLLITRNDPDTSLVNGDLGLCLADVEGQLHFHVEHANGPRAFPLGALPPHEPAFAMSIHKSQGSEYEHVAVLLPDDPMHGLLSRELLYTAASRARVALDLHASPDVVEAALARPVQRVGGLHARLSEAFAGSAGTLAAFPSEPSPWP